MSQLTADLVGFGFGAVNLLGGIPLALGKIGPNPYVGFRTRSTLENRDVWYRVNRPLGKVMILSGVLVAIAMFALTTLPAVFQLEIALLAGLVPMVIGVLFLAQKYLR